jgi:hypothetical protein
MKYFKMSADLGDPIGALLYSLTNWFWFHL